MQRIRRFTQYVLLAGSAVLLTGCALAPGGHISYDSEPVSLDGLVDIQPITPALVATYRDVVDRVAPMPSELREEIDSYQYRIGPGDVLTIIVYDHPELTIPAGSERSAEEAGNEVRRDGSIFYPYIGRVEVAGRTLEEVRTELARRLSNYLSEPQVDVRIAAFNSSKIYVSGAVETPGTLPITSIPMTLLDAIGQAGGVREDANWHEVILTRNGVEQRLSLYALTRQGDQGQNRLMRDGDVLHIPNAESRGVAVMGQVRNPGNLMLGNERLSLTDAISRSGGLSEETAEPTGIFVIRSNAPGADKLATVFQLDVSNAVAFSMGSHFELEPSDVVYVTTAPLARWNRVISLLVPSLVLPGNVVRDL